MDHYMVLSYKYCHAKKTVTSKCDSIARHFDGHAETLKQCMQHRPMWHVQGYIGSHWMLLSGDYLLRNCHWPPGKCQEGSQGTQKGVPDFI